MMLTDSVSRWLSIEYRVVVLPLPVGAGHEDDPLGARHHAA